MTHTERADDHTDADGDTIGIHPDFETGRVHIHVGTTDPEIGNLVSDFTPEHAIAIGADLIFAAKLLQTGKAVMVSVHPHTHNQN